MTRWYLFTPRFYEGATVVQLVVATSRDKGELKRLAARLGRSNGARHYDIRRFPR